MIKLGIVGYGVRGSHIGRLISERHPGVQLTAVCDKNLEKVRNLLVESNIDSNKVQLFTDIDEMLKKANFDALVLATTCDMHHIYGEKMLAAGVPLFFEKPVANSYENLEYLIKAKQKYQANVAVSFPLRMSPITKHAKMILNSGVLGKISMIQAYNNVPEYASSYFRDWYRDKNIIGSLFLQKATHDIDYLNDIVGNTPVNLCAMTSKVVFDGSKPANLTCNNCDKSTVCLESVYNYRSRNDVVPGEKCCFGQDTLNEDGGSILLHYDNGVHVNYSQYFNAHTEGQLRGARFLCEKGILEFDFYTGIMHITHHFEHRTDTVKFDLKGVHFGGDNNLVDGFYDLICGNESSNIATLEEGILSALLCIKAEESAQECRFVEIPKI